MAVKARLGLVRHGMACRGSAGGGWFGVVSHGPTRLGSLGMEWQVWVRHRSAGCGMAVTDLQARIGSVWTGVASLVQAWQAGQAGPGSSRLGTAWHGMAGSCRPGKFHKGASGMAIKLTSDQRDLITMLAGAAAGSEEKLAALAYHIEWVLNGYEQPASKDVWVFKDKGPSAVGPFALDREQDARVQALRLAVQAYRDQEADDITNAAEQFYLFLRGAS